MEIWYINLKNQTACLVFNQIWLKTMLHGDGSGLRLNDGFDVKLEIVGCSLMIVFGLTLCD